MAVKAVTTRYLMPGVIEYKWENMTGADVGAPVSIPHYADKSVQIGAQGGQTHGGATTVMQASLDPAADPADANYASSVWFTSTDPQGNNISATANKFEQIEELATWFRPSQSAGSAGDLDVILICKL